MSSERLKKKCFTRRRNIYQQSDNRRRVRRPTAGNLAVEQSGTNSGLSRVYHLVSKKYSLAEVRFVQSYWEKFSFCKLRRK